MRREAFDVVIVGGGLIGASLTVALSPLPLKVALIEAQPLNAASKPSWDERCIAINDASHRIFGALCVWGLLQNEAEPITSTHISERGRFGVARFGAAEAGLPALGYNVPVRALGQALWRQLQQTKAEVICPARLQSIEVNADTVVLTLDSRLCGHDEAQDRLTPHASRLTARLVIAADGANSPVREMLGISAQTRDYRQSAIVTAIKPSRPHKGCAYERFTPDGPIAVLPKPDGRCSLVWTAASEKVPEMLGWSDEMFLHEAQEAFGERLGKFIELGRRNAYPLMRVMSDRLTAPRVLFAGNAAQSLHPVAAQGFNLGLRDVAMAAGLLSEARDPGAPELLQSYEQKRVRDRDLVAGFTDHLVRVFSNRVPGLRGLRHLGLLALDLAPPLKDAVMWQNLGYSGATPNLVR